MQDAIFRAASRPEPVGAIEARILDGPLKGAVRSIPVGSLTKLIARLAPYGPPPKVAPKPVDPVTRAATLLQAARNLEKSGKAQPAVESYRRIVKDFPDTPAGKAAATRLKELRLK